MKNKRKKIDFLAVKKMAKNGIFANDIAEYFGCSRQYIHWLGKENGFSFARIKYFRHPNPRPGMSVNRRMLRISAQRLASKAINQGILIREPCRECGIFGQDKKGRSLVEAHHCDYKKPLDVVWLCRRHHGEWHRKNKPKE